MTFGEKLRMYRYQADMTQRQLESVLRWPHDKVSRLELGKLKPKQEEVFKLTGLLVARGVPIHMEWK